MAPKRRPKKGESRMDAAIDAMKPYGFPGKLVRTTVNSLLKVYGGNNEGWVFIEDSAYTLLIDTLLEKQADSSPQPQDGMIEANPDGPNEVTPAGCSNSALLACCNPTSDDTPLTNQTLDTLSAASGTSIQLPMDGMDTVSVKTEIDSELPLEAVKESGYQGRKRIKAGNETPIKAEKESEFQPVKKLALDENRVSKCPKLETGLRDKRYKPSFGWISDDDEEKAELMEVPLVAPWLSLSRARGNNG